MKDTDEVGGGAAPRRQHGPDDVVRAIPGEAQPGLHRRCCSLCRRRSGPRAAAARSRGPPLLLDGPPPRASPPLDGVSPTSSGSLELEPPRARVPPLGGWAPRHGGGEAEAVAVEGAPARGADVVEETPGAEQVQQHRAAQCRAARRPSPFRAARRRPLFQQRDDLPRSCSATTSPALADMVDLIVTMAHGHTCGQRCFLFFLRHCL